MSIDNALTQYTIDNALTQYTIDNALTVCVDKYTGK